MTNDHVGNIEGGYINIGHACERSYYFSAIICLDRNQKGFD